MAWKKAVKHRSVGDGYRDAREWDKASSAYRLHLDAHPNDAAIWVQYGHMLKESGRKEEAESAYNTAVQIKPEDPDAWIHLAHLLKGMGKYVGAYAAFVNANEIEFNEDLNKEMRSLRRLAGEAHPKGEILKDGTLLFAIQDLLIFLRYHVTMSGIQRVQCGISQHLMQLPDLDARFIITDHGGLLEPGTYWEIDPARLNTVIEYASGQKVDHDELKRLVTECEETAVTVTPGAGNTIILLGCFWAHDDTADQFIPAKRNGSRFGAYLYDIIPISHPEYCEPGLVKVFSQGLSEMCLVADFFLTISDYTRITLENFLRSHGAPIVPMMTVPLAHSLTGSEQKSGAWPTSLQKLKGAEYVTYVSTIEGRKNHIYVVNVWRELIAQGKPVPDLVFVGRRGWRVNGLIDFLEGTNYLDGRVHFVHDLSDGELNAVYKHSLFTVFTSLVEGWGLPVGESLLNNRLCVASNTTSVPEVGGSFVEYVDPNDVRDGIRKIGRLLEDRDYLASRQRNIEENFNPRGWNEVARTFVDKTRELSKHPFREVRYVPLREGELFRPGELARRPLRTDSFKARPTRLILAASFYTPESWGAWMNGKIGEVNFKTDLKEDEEIIVYVDIREANWVRTGTFTIALADPKRLMNQTPLPIPLGQETHQLQLRGLVGANGECRVLIQVEGDWTRDEAEGRDIVLGLTSIGYASPANHAARAEIYESFIFAPASEQGRNGPAGVDPGRVVTAVGQGVE